MKDLAMHPNLLVLNSIIEGIVEVRNRDGVDEVSLII